MAFYRYRGILFSEHKPGKRENIGWSEANVLILSRILRLVRMWKKLVHQKLTLNPGLRDIKKKDWRMVGILIMSNISFYPRSKACITIFFVILQFCSQL